MHYTLPRERKWRKRRQLLPLMVFFYYTYFFSLVSSTLMVFAFFSLFSTFCFFYLDVSLNAPTFPPLSFPSPKITRRKETERFYSRFSLCLVSFFRRWDKSFQRAKLCKLFMERQIRRRFSFVRMETAIRVTPIAVFFLHRKSGALVQFLFPSCVSLFIILFSLPPVSNF